MAGVLGMVAPAHAGFRIDRSSLWCHSPPVADRCTSPQSGGRVAAAVEPDRGSREQGVARCQYRRGFVANSQLTVTLLFGTSGPLAINTSLFRS